MCRKFIYLAVLIFVVGLSAQVARADAFLQDAGPDGIVSFEAENFDNNVAQGGNSWVLITDPTGFSGAGAMRAMPNTGTGRNTGYVTNSPRMDFKVIFEKTGTHYIWVRAYAPDEPTQPVGNNDSLHAGLDNTAIETCDRISGFGTSYTWTNDTMDNGSTLEVPSRGPHTFNIWMREDGAIVDKIVLTTNPNYTPTGNGPPQSPRGLALKAFNPDPPDGAKNVTAPLFKWSAGETAALHDVYFGTNPTPGPAEYKGRQPFTMYWHTPGLIPGTTYYWRIDEIEADGTTIHTGYVWSCMAAPLAAYNPDPPDGAKWIDIDADLIWSVGSTAITHDVYFGTNQADVAADTGGTFKGNQPGATYDPGTLAYDTTYYWRIDEVEADRTTKYKGNVWQFTTIGPAAGIRGYYYKNMNLSGAPVLIRVDPGVNFNWAAAAPDPVVGTDQFSVRWVGQLEAPFSEPFTFTTGSDDGVRLYLDGQLIIENWTDHSLTQNSSSPIDLVAGHSYGIVMEFYENTGDAVAQLFWQSPSQPRQIIPAGPLQLPLVARNPRPAHGATDVKHAPKLMWTAGEKAAKHNVYFGSDPTAVADATTASAGIYRGQQDLKATSYVPSEAPLQWNTTYYWRIDEVNGVDIWKGNVWSFTTADFIVVDDFEDYTDDVGNRIFQTWKDGWGYSEPAPGYPGNGTGSTVGYSQPPFAEQTTVHGGGQSMPLGYDNSGTGGKARYSETQREWTSPQDWTRNNVKALTLWFYGDPANVPEGLYVAVEDSAGRIKVVTYANPDAVLLNSWQEWNIETSQFSNAGVNLAAVKKMYIGLGSRVSPKAGGKGTIYIDDVRLYRPRCVPSLSKPAGDFSNNCVVDLPDLQMMAGEWLLATVQAKDVADVWFEAESPNTIAAPLQSWSDRPDALGGQYIAVVPGNNSSGNPPAAPNGRATYVFQVKAGVYKILARVIAPSGSDDSFWLRIEGATTQTFNHSSGWVRWGVQNGSTWHWAPVESMDDASQTVQFTMAAGTYTLEIAYREDGTLLDAFLITDKLDLDQRALLPDGVNTDLNADGKVDLADYALLADTWLNEQLWPVQ